MAESSEICPNNDDEVINSCYNCGFKIINVNQKVCQNCNTILNPNDLKWKSSFISFLILLCLIPILIAIISALTLNE
ncbi:MAG: hypothetical protein ACFE9R_19580 [Candidatus Hermodarchaeota archaeon]